ICRDILSHLLLFDVALRKGRGTAPWRRCAAVDTEGTHMDDGASQPTGAAAATVGASAVQIEHVHKWYGEFRVLWDVSLDVKPGERVVICGPSGSGKSTLLRCVNALEDYQQGRIVVDGKLLTNDLRRIDAVRREVGMVFQQFNLFPHLTVLENCTLAPIW